MRIVRVHDRGLPLLDDLGQLPRRREVDLVDRRQRNEIGALRGAPEQLPFAMRDEDRPVPAGAEAEDGQEDLLLSPAPGARGVDVDGEHSSQSFANFSPT